MSTTIQADGKGNLHLHSSLLPSPEPLAVYRIEEASGKLIISKQAPRKSEQEPFWKRATSEERVKAFRDWVNEAATPAGLSDYAVSRESIYD